MKKHLYVIIGCDVDPDRESFVGKIEENTLKWQGMLEGIPRCKARLAGLKDPQGKPPVFSWCLRADHQIATLQGSYERVLVENLSFLQNLEKSGDELSWHPHFWRHDDQVGCWYQEFWDREFQLRTLRESHDAFQRVLPGRGKSVRTGWSFHNNETYGALEQLGVEVDFGAIPGLKLLPRSDRVRSSNFYDSSLCEDQPFYPSRLDYRRKARVGEETFNVLELPVFVSRSLFWGLGSGLQLARKMKDPSQLIHAVKRPTHVINITGKSSWFAPLLTRAERMLRTSDRLFFNTYFHADEVLDNPHPFYSLEYMESNLRAILDLGRRAGAEVLFMRAMDVKRLVR